MDKTLGDDKQPHSDKKFVRYYRNGGVSMSRLAEALRRRGRGYSIRHFCASPQIFSSSHSSNVKPRLASVKFWGGFSLPAFLWSEPSAWRWAVRARANPLSLGVWHFTLRFVLPRSWVGYPSRRPKGCGMQSPLGPKVYPKSCLGSSICFHKRIKSTCKECGGSQICGHDRVGMRE